MMRGARREEAEALAAAVADAQKPWSCRACGRLFIGRSAYSVHFESGEGSRCIDGDARGQLEELDGAWIMRGSGAAGR